MASTNLKRSPLMSFESSDYLRKRTFSMQKPLTFGDATEHMFLLFPLPIYHAHNLRNSCSVVRDCRIFEFCRLPASRSSSFGLILVFNIEASSTTAVSSFPTVLSVSQTFLASVSKSARIVTGESLVMSVSPSEVSTSVVTQISLVTFCRLCRTDCNCAVPLFANDSSH